MYVNIYIIPFFISSTILFTPIGMHGNYIKKVCVHVESMDGELPDDGKCYIYMQPWN
jgi:hypothetical protein